MTVSCQFFTTEKLLFGERPPHPSLARHLAAEAESVSGLAKTMQRIEKALPYTGSNSKFLVGSTFV
jgi:hypothetical protein